MTENYSNVNGFIVILADRRDPDVSWEHHLERGSAGGVDCVAPVDTPVYAPADCEITNTPNNGTGGNTVTMRFADGWRDQFMHLSRFAAPGKKRKGELVGYSGDSGSPGQPHVHWHRIDPRGARRNPWHYFTSTPSGGTTTNPVAPNEADTIEEDDMFTIYRAPNRGYLVLGPSTFLELGADLTQATGVDGAETLALYQGLGAREVVLKNREWDVLRINTLAAQ